MGANSCACVCKHIACILPVATPMHARAQLQCVSVMVECSALSVIKSCCWPGSAKQECTRNVEQFCLHRQDDTLVGNTTTSVGATHGLRVPGLGRMQWGFVLLFPGLP